MGFGDWDCQCVRFSNQAHFYMSREGLARYVHALHSEVESHFLNVECLVLSTVSTQCITYRFCFVKAFLKAFAHSGIVSTAVVAVHWKQTVCMTLGSGWVEMEASGLALVEGVMNYWGSAGRKGLCWEEMGCGARAAACLSAHPQVVKQRN